MLPGTTPTALLPSTSRKRTPLHAGRKPREDTAGYTVKMLCNDFLNAKKALVDSGELAQRSWQNYRENCEFVLSELGKTRLVGDLDPNDFAAPHKAIVERGWGAVTVGNCIQRVRVLFKFPFDNGTIDRPVRYGQNFKVPSRKTVRIDRANKGPKMFSPEEVRALINGTGASGAAGSKTVRVGPTSCTSTFGIRN